MNKSDTATNAAILEKEFEWFSALIQVRFTRYFQQEGGGEDIYGIKPPEIKRQSAYGQFLTSLTGSSAGKGVDDKEQIARRLLVLLALAPHVRPAILDVFFTRNKLYDRGFTEFGGVSSKQHGGFLPTGETALFLLAGADTTLRIQLSGLFAEDDALATGSILSLKSQSPGEPFLSGVLTLSGEALARLTTGEEEAPRYGSDFPARRLETTLTWDDLILDAHLKEDLDEISTWIDKETEIMEDLGLGRHLKPGYRVLFHGPPGTGKTLCATLLGQRAERPVYRIDLSQVVSKYIGETEKNLARLFARAEHKNWILFFDEADALFGKRTSAKGGNDRYANQETAYLLQRIEAYDGVVILATNLKGNIDAAFARRFQAMLYFPVPDAAQRLRLWENIFGEDLALCDEIDFGEIARDYELAGGSIVNVLRYCALAAVRRDPVLVERGDVLEGVRRELRKGGKTG